MEKNLLISLLVISHIPYSVCFQKQIIRYSLNFQKQIYSVFSPYSLFVATLEQTLTTLGCESDFRYIYLEKESKETIIKDSFQNKKKRFHQETFNKFILPLFLVLNYTKLLHTTHQNNLHICCIYICKNALIVRILTHPVFRLQLSKM